MPVPIVGGLLGKFMLTRVGKFLGGIPKPVWIALAVVIVIGVSVWLHGKKVNTFEATIRADERSLRDAAWQARFDKMKQNAVTWKQKYETASGQLAQARRNSHEATLRNDASRTGALLVRGPGKATAEARCGPVSNTGVSTGASGHNSSGGAIIPGLAGVPREEWSQFAIVRFSELTKRGQICDANRSEVTTWREHDNEQRALRKGMLDRAAKDQGR